MVSRTGGVVQSNGHGPVVRMRADPQPRVTRHAVRARLAGPAIEHAGARRWRMDDDRLAPHRRRAPPGPRRTVRIGVASLRAHHPRRSLLAREKAQRPLAPTLRIVPPTALSVGRRIVGPARRVHRCFRQTLDAGHRLAVAGRTRTHAARRRRAQDQNPSHMSHGVTIHETEDGGHAAGVPMRWNALRVYSASSRRASTSAARSKNASTTRSGCAVSVATRAPRRYAFEARSSRPHRSWRRPARSNAITTT